MSNNKELFILSEKYAPETVDELILPKAARTRVNQIIKRGEIPNLMLSGRSGCGKTQTIKTICKQLNAQVLFVNGSDQGRSIDYARNTIQGFASTPSIVGKNRKVVIFDEFDNATKDVALLLRGLIEQCQANCSFVFTCNYINRVEPAIVGRTTPISFEVPQEEYKEIFLQFFKRLIWILDSENIGYNKEVLVDLIKKEFGNWRHIINICQGYSGSTIDVGILGIISEKEIVELFSFLKAKKFDKMREWIAEYSNNDARNIIRLLYDKLEDYMEKTSIPVAITILGECDVNIALDTDPEIQLCSSMVKMMANCNYK